jgi:hypothetical protein
VNPEGDSGLGWLAGAAGDSGGSWLPSLSGHSEKSALAGTVSYTSSKLAGPDPNFGDDGGEDGVEGRGTATGEDGGDMSGGTAWEYRRDSGIYPMYLPSPSPQVAMFCIRAV